MPRNEYEQANPPVLSGRAEAPWGVPRNEYEQAIRDRAPGYRQERQTPGNAGPVLAIERNGHNYANGSGHQQGAGGAPPLMPMNGGGDSRHPPVLSGRAEAPWGAPRNEYEQAIRDHAPGDRYEHSGFDSAAPRGSNVNRYPSGARHPISAEEAELEALVASNTARAKEHAARVEERLVTERARSAQLTATALPTPNPTLDPRPTQSEWVGGRSGGGGRRGHGNVGQGGGGGTGYKGIRPHDLASRTPGDRLASAESSVHYHRRCIEDIDPRTLTSEQLLARARILSGPGGAAPSVDTRTAAAPTANHAVNLAATAPEAAKAKVPKKGKTATEAAVAATRAAQAALDNAAALADAVLEIADDEDRDEDGGDTEEALKRRFNMVATENALTPEMRLQRDKAVLTMLLEHKTKADAAIFAVTAAAAVAATATDAGAGAGTADTATTAPAPAPAPAPAAAGRKPSPKRARGLP